MKRIIVLFLMIIILIPFNFAVSAGGWCSCPLPGKDPLCVQLDEASLKTGCTGICTISTEKPLKCFDPKPATGGTGSSDPNLQTVTLDNPLNIKDTELTTILGNAVKAALGIMGGLVLLMIVWGGFTWLTGMGNPEKIKAGTNTITWAVLGAVVVLGSYFLLNLVLKALSGGL
ncbi:MAG: pilin [bacterium]|nr:pilin [bacterium]